MADNQENKKIVDIEPKAEDENSGFEVNNLGQNLGGGKGKTGLGQMSGSNQHPLGNDAGQFDDEDEFSTTDQSVAQVAPGQTATYKNQGGG